MTLKFHSLPAADIPAVAQAASLFGRLHFGHADATTNRLLIAGLNEFGVSQVDSLIQCDTGQTCSRPRPSATG